MRVPSPRGLLSFAFSALLLIVAIVLSALLHLRTELGRHVARDLLNHYVSALISGRLQANDVAEIGLDRIVVRDVSLYDPAGVRVISGDEIILKIDPFAALDGTLRFSHATLRGGRLELIDDGEGTPTFLRAFDPADTSPSEGPPFHAIVDDMHLEGVRAYGELLGVTGIYAENVRAHGRMEFYHDTVIEVFSATGEVHEPFGYVGYLDNVVATVNSNDAIGTDLYVRGHTGGDRVRLDLHYGLPPTLYAGDETPLELEIMIHAEPVHGETLAASGFEWASILHGEIRGPIRLHGPADHLRLHGELRTEGGYVEITGELPTEGEVWVRAESQSLDVAGLIAGAPEAMVAGRVGLRIPDEEDATPVFEGKLEPFEVYDYAVPALEVTGRMEDEAILLDAVRGSGPSGVIEANGRVDFDGNYSLSVDASLQRAQREPNLHALVPALRGAVDLRAVVEGGADRTSVRGTARFRGFAYDEVQAATLTATGSVVLDEDLPRLDLRVQGGDVRVAGIPLGSGSARMVGDRGRYRFEGTLRDQGRRESRFESNIAIVGDEVRVDVPVIVLAREGVTFTGQATGIRVDDRGVDLASLALSSGDQRIEGRVSLRDWGDDEIDLRVERLSLADLHRYFGPLMPDTTGEVDLQLEVRGDADTAPRAVLEGTARDVTIAGVPGAAIDVRVELEDGMARINAATTIAEEGALSVSGTGFVSGGIYDLERAILDGVYSLALSADALRLEVLARALSVDLTDTDLEGTTGHLTGRINIEGPIAAPTFDGGFRISDLTVPGWPQLSLRVGTRYEYGSFSSHSTLADAHGTLVEGEGSALIDLMSAAEDPFAALEALRTSPWRFSLRVPPRRMVDVPTPITEALPFDASDFLVAGSFSLAGGAFRTRGNLQASVDYRPLDGEALCGTTSEPSISVTAKLDRGIGTATVHGIVDGRRVLRVNATAPIALEEWLAEGAIPALPETDVKGELLNAPAQGVPLLCEMLAGDLNGRFELTDLFGSQPFATAEIASPALQVRRLELSARTGTPLVVVETQPVQIRVGLVADDDAIALSSDMLWWNGGTTQASARIAADWAGGQLMPSVAADAPMEAEADIRTMPLEAAVAWVPGLGNINGHIQGRARLDGTLLDPRLSGSLEVADGEVDLRGLGQRLRGIRGDVELTEQGIVLEGFSASDNEGTVHGSGLLELDGLTLTRSTLQIRAQDFPIRSEGTVMARLTGRAELSNDFVEDGIDGGMFVESLAVTMPETSSRSPQALSAHADICVRLPGAAGQSGGCEGDVVEDGTPYEVRLAVDASRPFWVRSPDFEALVSAQLEVRYADPNLYVGGDVDMRRGHFEVFGRRFNVEEGSLIFDPNSASLNPSVLLVATHQLRNDPNRTVTVHASGTLSNPVVEFSSSVPTANEGEIIALLITGSTQQRRTTAGTSALEAGQEAADFLAGVAFGVATLSMREEFGRHFPSISVETAGSGFQSARFRAGFTADDLLPERMRSVVEGMYIEGYFTAGNENDPQQQGGTSVGTGQDSGFLIELQFPHNIVGTGTYSPPANWGVDVTWEP